MLKVMPGLEYWYPPWKLKFWFGVAVPLPVTVIWVQEG